MKLNKWIFGTVAVSMVFIAACTVPAWVNSAEADAKVAAPIAAGLIDVIDPSLAPVVTLVENGFNALVTTLDTYKASPTATNLQAVQSAFEAVNANVSQLESAAQIKNGTTATTVSAVVQLLTQAVTEIAALVPAQTAQSAVLIPDSSSRIPKTGSPMADSGTRKSTAGSQTASSAASGPSVAPQAAKGWTADDLKREYNRIVKDDPRFKPLK
jgi:hypothetical protein